jgi:hypothetical protein
MKSMRSLLLAVSLLPGAFIGAQERPVPKDSVRVTVSGCIKGHSLIATARSSTEPNTSRIAPGRRLRLAGNKKLVKDLRAEKRQLVEVTGLIRESHVKESGIPIGKGGRIRIGGGSPVSRDPAGDPRRDPLVNEPVMDVESWRPLPETCPSS